jgi:hypothetical protein
MERSKQITGRLLTFRLAGVGGPSPAGVLTAYNLIRP